MTAPTRTQSRFATMSADAIRRELSPMSHSAAGADRFDMHSQTGQFLDVLLDVFGLDPEPYADVVDALDRAARIEAWAAKWQASTTLDERAAARMIGDATDYGDAAGTVSASVRATNDTERAAGGRIWGRAHLAAAAGALAALRGHAAHTFAELQRVHADSVAAYLDAADKLTEAGVRTLEDATRANLSDVWFALEAASARLDLVAEFVRHATPWGVLPGDDVTNAQRGPGYGARRWYTNPQKAETLNQYAHVYRSMPPWQFRAHVMRQAGAALRSVEDARRTPEPQPAKLPRGGSIAKRAAVGALTAADVDNL